MAGRCGRPAAPPARAQSRYLGMGMRVAAHMAAHFGLLLSYYIAGHLLFLESMGLAQGAFARRTDLRPDLLDLCRHELHPSLSSYDLCVVAPRRQAFICRFVALR